MGSRLVSAARSVARAVSVPWRELGEIDRWLDRHPVVPDHDYPRVTTMLDDSAIVRAGRRWLARIDPGDSRVVGTAADLASRWRALERWQQMRLGGIALTAALAVHASLCAVLPARLIPRLPVVVWIGAAALGVTVIVASRALAAAWDNLDG